jgi:hypothetical protein
MKGVLQLRINNFSKYAGLKENKWIHGKQTSYINKLPFKIMASLIISHLPNDLDLGVYIDFNLLDKKFTNKFKFSK